MWMQLPLMLQQIQKTVADAFENEDYTYGQ